ncbi:MULTISPECIES: ABC transporter ATP-binding protein [unclassified Nitratiruptor]|uniref:ABC transporter ATP-binding protein n=1 Tax=unclassified Nitratiruptor TaxID=2624044 RepID=UPI001935A8DA|nr:MULTISPECIES: ATP-binding cassette domain-containing protein [unclassified Nitratiruptor]BCD60415.1 peptide/nickel transport system ATP-binding protein [Nitratiruptor sp. YY08-10]BCD64096.1 peptide/nickel transport system ATP-binding protein [Nitratiruptor sp. YY08-14]
MEKVLEIVNLTFGYTKSKPLFTNFSITVHKGEVVAIVGPSGIGKSTLFELISGFLKPWSGSIQAQKLSTIFQDPYSSFHPTYTIIEQIKDVASLEGLEELAKSMDIEQEILYKYPHEVSGGQLQRCSILRAVQMKPKLLLADEPTSALDNVTQLKVMKTLLQFLDRVGILLITHDLDLAKWCSDRIIEIGDQN